MKHILLKKESKTTHHYRANLHCHSTNSDGRKTVEELKRDYLAHGYSIVAFTDHDVFINHNDLSDDNFLALNGYEVEITKESRIFETAKCCHLCFISLNKDNDVPVCLHRSKYAWGNAIELSKKMNWDKDEADYEREYNPKCINDMIKKARKRGFFVTYNHPQWSLEHYPDYSKYKRMNAMEIRNGSTICCGIDSDNGIIYDEMLNLGNRIYCIATDDNHNIHSDDSQDCDSYSGCVYIVAKRLEYRTITKALEKGSFYSSSGNYKNNGPRILSIIYDDELKVVEVETTDARTISFLTDTRSFYNWNSIDNESINYASFKLRDEVSYFRIEVVDKNGFKAYSNAYFKDSLCKN